MERRDFRPRRRTARIWDIGIALRSWRPARETFAEVPPEVQVPEYTATSRAVWLSLLAVVIGTLWGLAALGMEALIGLITNAVFYQRFLTSMSSIIVNKIGLWIILAPIVGGLVSGIAGYYGGALVRRGGISATVEQSTIRGSKVQLRAAILEPLAGIVYIGLGGPLGAEGSFVFGGGSFGSLVGRILRLNESERRTLLAAGAAAGMAATFSAPFAGVLLAIELFVFEIKPRSFVPIALASGMATLVRDRQKGVTPLFALPHTLTSLTQLPEPSARGMLGAFVVGLLAGLAAWLLTRAVSIGERFFRALPVSPLWWPLLANIPVGVGGYFVPRTLGVGYETTHSMLLGQFSILFLLALLGVKAIIWTCALAGGTTGGIIAPLLFMGAAMGGIESVFLPGGSSTPWAYVSMVALLSGAMNIPFTAIALAFELTGSAYLAGPVVIACAVAHLVSVLTQRHTLVTSRIARQGFHISREYVTDPLQVLSVREVMRTSIITTAPEVGVDELRRQLIDTPEGRRQRLYPVVNGEGILLGVVTTSDLAGVAPASGPAGDGADARRLPHGHVADIMRTTVITALADEALQTVVRRMVDSDVSRVPVVATRDHQHLVGLISQRDILVAREHTLAQERQRAQRFYLRTLLPGGRRGAAGSPARAEHLVTTGDVQSGRVDRRVLEHGEVPNEHADRSAQGTNREAAPHDSNQEENDV